MSEAWERVVFDCNVFAGGLINPTGSAGECIERVLDGELLLFLSEFVIGEIRRIPQKETPSRLGVTNEKVEALLSRLLPIAHLVENPPSVYQHPIDPKDSHYVDLAVASNAKLIVSRDKHLLNLSKPSRPGASEFIARFPQLQVLDPVQLLEMLRARRSDQ
jgi:putative PIN family toxin of toxin-antitoxin system